MNDLISRERAISELVNMVTDHYKDEPFHGLMLHWTGIKAMLEALPSAEPEIIRCKDCIYVSHEPCKDFENVWICNRTPFTRANGGNMPNDFCSYGEKGR